MWPFDDIANSVVDSIYGVAPGAVEDVGNTYGDALDYTQKEVADASNAIVGGFDNVRETIGGAIDDVETRAANGYNWVADKVDSLEQLPGRAFNYLEQEAAGVASGVKGQLQDAVGGVRTTLTDAVGGVEKTLSDSANSLGSAFGGVAQNIKDTVAGLTDSLIDKPLSEAAGVSKVIIVGGVVLAGVLIVMLIKNHKSIGNTVVKVQRETAKSAKSAAFLAARA